MGSRTTTLLLRLQATIGAGRPGRRLYSEFRSNDFITTLPRGFWEPCATTNQNVDKQSKQASKQSKGSKRSKQNNRSKRSRQAERASHQTMKQASKQANTQANKQANKQASKQQVSKRASKHRPVICNRPFYRPVGSCLDVPIKFPGPERSSRSHPYRSRVITWTF